MTAVGLDAAIAQAEQAVARHESQSASDPFHFQLIEHRYVALRDLLNALSAEVRPHGTVTTPGIDLVEIVGLAIGEWRNADNDLSAPLTPSLAEYIADAVWQAQGNHGPHGTVTDAAVDALRRSLYASGLDWADAGDEGLSDDDFYRAAERALRDVEAAREVHP